MREDLYYRLAVFQINLPPLRRRRGDIPLLAQAFVGESNDRHQCEVEGLRDEALAALRVYNWPGNVRQLRERTEDIALLVRHFIETFNAEFRKNTRGFTREALKCCEQYSWPGNVRELRNVIERSVIVAGRGLIERSHLPPFLRDETAGDTEDGEVIRVPVGTSARKAEKRLILETLKHVNYNKAEAARRLGLDVKTIRNKLARYEAEDED